MIGHATTFAAILATSLAISLATAEAAERLRGVTPVRVRQMIGDGTLYAVRIDGRHGGESRCSSSRAIRWCPTWGR
jgi:hypothetical protein